MAGHTFNASTQEAEWETAWSGEGVTGQPG